MTLQEFNTITAHDRLTLVDFYAVWCGPCKATHHILDELEERMCGRVDVLRIDIDYHGNAELVNHFRIMAVPTVVIDGEVTFVGAPSEEELINALESKL